ncbi:MAG TPA: hypothetical protein VMF13_10465, partial [Luteitalea sp.]|nr:hypothetical protein [Luteitalea sp.]
MRSRLLLGTATLVALCLARPPLLMRAQGQAATPQPPATDAPQPTFRVEANYVRVDVYPTTAD